MIVDTVMYNGEADILDLHLNILNDHVDQFIIVEAPTTFSGHKKPLYFERDMERFVAWEKKIKYFVIDENYTDEEIEDAEISPNTIGARHWVHEFLQKESIKKALTHLSNDDTVFIGDVDEIWQPNEFYPDIGKLKLRVYTYYLNNRSNEEFWGTLVGKYKYIKSECLNHLRSNPPLKSNTYHGWHFTSMAPDLRRKLKDSYTKESYATKEVLDKLEENIKNNRDFLGRGFKYEKDESDWPLYLKQNKYNYKHLLL